MAGSIQRRFKKISCVCASKEYSFSVQQLMMMMIMLMAVVVDCLIRLNRVFCVLVCWCVL